MSAGSTNGTPPRRRRLPASERREQILAVAQQAFVRDGYRGTTALEIGRKAGVSETLVVPLLDAQGRPRIAYLNSHDLGYSWCDAGCESPAAWKHRTVETSEDLEAQYPVARPVTCDASTWDNYSPNLRLDSADAALKVAERKLRAEREAE